MIDMTIDYKLPLPDGIPGIGFRTNYNRNEDAIYNFETYDPSIRSKYFLFTLYQVLSSGAIILGTAEVAQRIL